MEPQAGRLEDAIAATLPLRVRLGFVLVFLILQLYSLLVQVYKVSQEGISSHIESPWQRWFLHWAFLGFLRKSRMVGGLPHNTREQRGQREQPPADDGSPSWASLWVQGNTVAIFIVGIALSAPTFTNLRYAQQGLNTANCSAPIDGDIAGDGVRSALWVQQGILWLSVLTGVFLNPSQPRPTAVKELATGLVINHLSLAIAVLVQMGQGTLSALDAAIVVMLLDAQNLALSVACSSRETLAARWEIVMVTATQLFGLVVIGVVLSRFEDRAYITSDCSCFSFFWWAWQSTCPSGTAVPAAERAVLWAYYAFRWLNSLQNWHFGIRYMWEFNILEQGSPDIWGEVDPTIGFAFLQNLLFGAISSASAELTIAAYTSGKEAKPFTVGQITAMVIAVTTTLRAAWLFFRRFDLLGLIGEVLWFLITCGTAVAGAGEIGGGRQSSSDEGDTSSGTDGGEATRQKTFKHDKRVHTI